MTIRSNPQSAWRLHSESEVPAGWFRSVMGDHLPPRVTGLERSSAVDVHQLRAGHWSGVRSYLHRIGRSPSPIPGGCQGCNRDDCRVLVPLVPGGVGQAGPCPAPLPSPDGDENEGMSHHPPGSGGGPGDRRGGGLGGGRQRRPEPTGYTSLRSGGNDNNNRVIKKLRGHHESGAASIGRLPTSGGVG